MVNLSIQKITIYSASSLIKRFLAAFILVACASHSSHLLAAASEKLQASVDRTQIYQSETVELTVIGQLELEINFSSLFNLRNMELPAPDIGSLKDNFDIIDQQQKYNVS